MLIVRPIFLVFFAFFFLGCSSEFFAPNSATEKMAGRREDVFTKTKGQGEDIVSREIPKLDEVRITSSWTNNDAGQVGDITNLFWNESGTFNQYSFLKREHKFILNEEMTKFHKFLQTNEDRNKAELNSTIYFKPLVIEDHMLYIDDRMTLRYVRLDNLNDVIWKYKIKERVVSNEFRVSAGMIYGEGNIYLTNGSENVVAISLETGEEVWVKPLGNIVKSVPRYYMGRVLLQSIDNKLYVLDAKSGDLIWVYEATNPVFASSPQSSLAVSENIVVITGGGGELIALDLFTGSPLWRKNIGFKKNYLNNSMMSRSSLKTPYINDGNIYISMEGDGFYVISLYEGNIIWSKNYGESGKFWLSGNVIFIVTEDNDLRALDKRTGKLFWRLELEGEQVSYPILVNSQVFLVNDNSIIKIDPYLGKIIAKIDYDGSKFVGHIIVVDGKLILFDLNRNLGILS